MSIEALSTVTAAPARLEGLQGSAGGGSQAHGDVFAQMLAQPPAAGGPQPNAAGVPARIQVLGSSGQTGLGEDVIASLRKFGQTVGKMEDIGAYKQSGARSNGGPAAGAPQPSALPGPAEQDPKGARRTQAGQDYIGQAVEMANESLGQQAQLYKVMMDFTLVQSSAESLNKSLKTLLTQGGG